MLFAKYKDGRLTEAIFPEDIDDPFITIPTTEKLLTSSHPDLGKYTHEEIPMRTAREKVIMFCTAYKHYRGVHYVAKDRESANIKHVPVSRELLDIFFQSPLHHFTIDNYISRINITRDWAKNGLPDKNRGGSAHPNYWDEAYYKSLTGEALTSYMQHLVKLGFVKKSHPQRGTYFEEGKKGGSND